MRAAPSTSAYRRCPTGELEAQPPADDVGPSSSRYRRSHPEQLAELEGGHRRTARSAEHAQQRAEASARVIADDTDRIREALLADWDGERDAARTAARAVLNGPGRLGPRRPAPP